ncbi:hypothetical protein QN391_25905, partial [Pseudomonas sp. CCI1.2]|uniref:hypothetical protein n=1 Tax=Pseudomonas sp. CCI1.2 TaxID=3048614 RepID=UPI002B2312D6
AQRLRSAAWFHGASFRNLIFNSRAICGQAAICSQLVGEGPSDLIAAFPQNLWDRIYSGRLPS